MAGLDQDRGRKDQESVLAGAKLDRNRWIFVVHYTSERFGPGEEPLDALSRCLPRGGLGFLIPPTPLAPQSHELTLRGICESHKTWSGALGD